MCSSLSAHKAHLLGKPFNMTSLSSIQPILDRFKQSAKEIYGDRLVKILLYGSYARGEQHEESDIDLMVVLKDEGFDKGKDREPLREVSFQFLYNESQLIMPVLISKTKYESDNTSPFLYFVKRDQIEI